jgi:hypothetical protein
MSDALEMLKRQAEWQKRRSQLPWPEKIRMVEAMRESLKQLRGSVSGGPMPPQPEPFSPASEQG